ncbi:MAG: hypothetical protein K2J60_19455 [Acetatifactor sp.]|nr:hypothetical protein [Acetatifactor sp.]
MEENYNTIIKQAVRAVLKPKGLYQKGSSRIWVDDNGWFFTVVDFQGSWCDRGSYLNVGMQHLWNEWGDLRTVCGIRKAREWAWVGYKGNTEIFSQEITSLAETALERVLEYRTLADPETAKSIPLINSGIAPFWSAWDQFMTAALAGDIPLCLELESKVRRALDIIPIDGGEELLAQTLSLLDEPQKIHTYIVDKIAVQRAYWRSKPGLKRLPVHPEYG